MKTPMKAFESPMQTEYNSTKLFAKLRNNKVIEVDKLDTNFVYDKLGKNYSLYLIEKWWCEK